MDVFSGECDQISYYRNIRVSFWKTVLPVFTPPTQIKLDAPKQVSLDRKFITLDSVLTIKISTLTFLLKFKCLFFHGFTKIVELLIDFKKK